MQRLLHLKSAARPVATMLTLIFLLLLGIAPSYAQSNPDSELFNAAIAAPTHESPAQGAISTALTDEPVGMPTLSWSAVAGATLYNVQISSSSGFASTIVSQNTEATSYTYKEVLADGTYFWRVRAQVDKEWGNFSEPWSFSKDWSAGGVVKPLLLAPANDPDQTQIITSFSPEHFSWEPVPGAAAYKLEISLSSSFNDAKPYQITTLKTNHTPVTQFANNQYYWRVTPIDARDHSGEPSEVRTFTFGWNQIPTLLTPEDEIETRFIPRFSWTAVSGASSYILEISTQENFTSIDESITTRNTSFTLEENLPNNKDYFWRVRAVSPQKVNGPASDVRRFRAAWVQPPIMLSPPLRSINHIYPYFSWTPVAGAESYQIQIATGTGFDDTIEDITLLNATSYTQPEWKEIIFGGDYLWRVRAKDAQGNFTNWSNEQGQGFFFVTSPPPNLIYPEPYYVPDAVGMPVHTDRTIAYPIFVWDTTHQYNGGNGPAAFVYPDYYKLEVATQSAFEPADIVFTMNSAGQAAVPTEANPFPFIDKTLYYWRVTPMRIALPEDVKMAEGTVWETRLDRTVQQLPMDGDTVPDISHPQDGFIAVDTAPILGWLPVADTDYYEVEISDNRDFTNLSNIVETAKPNVPYYAPWQEQFVPMPPGAYWWRVRAHNATTALTGDWSEVRHFFVMDDLMTGSDYDYELPNPGTLLSPGDPAKYDPALSLVATDTFTAAAPYNVGALHVVQDRSLAAENRKWVIAFGAADQFTGTLTYALYFDTNQLENVGGTTDQRNKPITFDPLYLPEYIIYLERTNDTISNALFYEWDGSRWTGNPLSGLGGSYVYDADSQAVQVDFPYATIVRTNEDQFSGAIALTVFSTASASAAGPEDSAPRQSFGVGSALVDSPALVSNMPMLLFPFDTPLTNPVVFHELPSLRWRMPHYNSIDGYIVQVARNADFTPDAIVETWETFESSTTSYYGAAPTAFHSGKSYNDDESYYWRVRYRHERYDKATQYDVSPWSQPMRFKLTSYQPGNPTVRLGNQALTQAAPTTPSFTWDRVEGAARYSIQVDNDFNMDTPLMDKEIDGNSFTSADTLADGTYYWRVAMRRSDDVLGQWTSIMSFTKTSLVPTLISPITELSVANSDATMTTTVVNNQPTFVWAATFSNTGELQIATPRYRLQWANNPQFNSPVEIETEATSYTPIKGKNLTDGTWYWRVAVIDGNGRRGPDSAAATFYKEYLRPEVLSPIQGSKQSGEIVFAWSPLDGAAFYKLEIDDNEAFDSPIRVSTDNTRYTHTDTFAEGNYYWRVQMVDKDNKPGPTITSSFIQGPEFESAIFIPIILSPNE